jgi:hypothetical protein
MEELNSSEEDSEGSVFLSANEDVYQDLCSAGSRGLSDKVRSKQQGGGREGVKVSSTGGGGQEHEQGYALHSPQRTGVQQSCECCRIHMEAQNSKKTLHVLSIGLMDDDGTHLFSFDTSHGQNSRRRPCNRRILNIFETFTAKLHCTMILNQGFVHQTLSGQGF